MGKKNRDETKEERRARKRAKKEAKRKKEARAAEHITVEGKNEALSIGRLPPDVPSMEQAISVNQAHTKSLFQRKRLKMIVTLFPAALGNVMGHVRDSLRSLLLKYSDGVGGVLLAFDNIEISSDAGDGSIRGIILNELPHIHYLVQLDALLFCPVVGQQLTGVVRYVFDRDLQQWMLEDGSKVLGNEDSVDFVIEKVHECEGVISMEGSHPSVC